MTQNKDCKHYMLRTCDSEGNYQCEDDDCLKVFHVQLHEKARWQSNKTIVFQEMVNINTIVNVKTQNVIMYRLVSYAVR